MLKRNFFGEDSEIVFVGFLWRDLEEKRREEQKERAIGSKTAQVRFWLLLVFLFILDFSIWSFLNIQYIVDWCGRKGPQISLLRLFAYLFALFCFYSFNVVGVCWNIGPYAWIWSILYLCLNPILYCFPCPAHGLIWEMELFMLINIFFGSPFLCVYHVFIHVLCFLSRCLSFWHIWALLRGWQRCLIWELV